MVCFVAPFLLVLFHDVQYPHNIRIPHHTRHTPYHIPRISLCYPIIIHIDPTLPHINNYIHLYPCRNR